MNIERKNIDEVNLVLTMQVEKADYMEAVDKALKNYRKNANIPGFRQGCVPMGLIKKQYGKAVEAEELNKKVGEALYEYIKKENLQVLGDPLPSETEKSEVDLDSDKPCKLVFDVALAPAFEVELNGRNQLTQYEIAIDDKMMADTIKQYTGRFGSYEQAEVAEENDLVKGIVEEMENGVVKEGGIKNDAAILSPKYVSDDAKKVFIGAKKGAVVTFNPKNAMESDTEVAAFLKIDKANAAEGNKDYQFTINEITRFNEAPLNQDLFDKAFGKDVVKSEDEFKAKLKEELANSLVIDSDYKLLSDARAAILKKMEDLKFPEAFLMRWLKATHKENLSDEALEKQFPGMIEGLKWQLAKEQIVKKNDVKVNDDDMINFGKKVARAQFAQYGMMSVPEDVAERYAKDMLKDKEAVKNMFDRVLEDKVLEIVKNTVKLNKKEISLDDFNKLVEEEAK
ncbi:MAG: trigger factor [Paludibacteraceae bacterium]|nr:trigger factor [Paludibacteraceae bacterium]